MLIFSASDRKKEAFVIVNSVKGKIFCLLLSALNKVFSLFIDHCAHCVSLKKNVPVVQTKGSTGDLLIDPLLIKEWIIYRSGIQRALLNAKHPQEMPEHFPVYFRAQSEPDNLHMQIWK